MEVLTSTHAETTFTLCNIQTRVNDFERSLEFNYSKVEENAESIVQLRSENRVLHKTIDDLRHEFVKVRTGLNVIQNRQDAYERRSREWGIRVHGIQERPREDTHVVLCKLLVDHKLAGISTTEEASEAIEHCHRLGQFQKGRTRTTIANFYSRPMRNVILKEVSAVNNSDLDIYIVEDMIKADHLLKIQVRDQMKNAY